MSFNLIDPRTPSKFTYAKDCLVTYSAVKVLKPQDYKVIKCASSLVVLNISQEDRSNKI